MLWSLVKIIAFLAVAAALVFGLGWIMETPGEVRIAFGSREVFLSPIGFLIAVVLLVLLGIVVLKLVGLLIAVIRFLLGDETAISRHFSRSRERRGYAALSDGLVALAAGDSRIAMKKAQKADRLLGNRDLPRLLSAQAAEQSGNRDQAFEAYKALLPDDRTRPVGIQGLMRLKLEEGDTDAAMALAKKAFALRPDNEGVLRTLFDLQSKSGDWSGARETLTASMHARLLPRDVGVRRDAVLSLADARAALAEGDTARGNEAAIQANKLAPTLAPAAALAARAQAERGQKRKATRILTTAWTANPTPELAAAFAAIEPEETPEARRKRFATLVAANQSSPEGRLLEAELALAAEDFPGARKALGDLAVTEPTTRSLALMAAIERGSGESDEVVRGWLAKALGASRGPPGVCGKCNHVHAHWEPVCENCGAFDTLDWRTPTHAEDTRLADSAMLPLIIGGGATAAPAAPEPAPTPEPPVPPAEPEAPAVRTASKADIEDAELASAADQARVAGGA
jgi:HemY protein